MDGRQAGDTPAAPARHRRAAALPPDERRRAIVDATVPLLLERGHAVTTRQIAEAAGIAEGTIFRVFPDKEAVVRAAVEATFDPAPTERAMHDVDRSLPFEDQLAEAVAIMQQRMAVIWRLGSMLGEWPVKARRPPPSPGLTGLLADHVARLRLDPAAAALRLRALTLASTHPALIGDEPLDPREIVSLLLDGIRARPDVHCP